MHRCAAQERPVQPSARSYLSHLDVWNGIDDCFLKEKNKHTKLFSGYRVSLKKTTWPATLKTERGRGAETTEEILSDTGNQKCFECLDL